MFASLFYNVLFLYLFFFFLHFLFSFICSFIIFFFLYFVYSLLSNRFILYLNCYYYVVLFFPYFHYLFYATNPYSAGRRLIFILLIICRFYSASENSMVIELAQTQAINHLTSIEPS